MTITNKTELAEVTPGTVIRALYGNVPTSFKRLKGRDKWRCDNGYICNSSWITLPGEIISEPMPRVMPQEFFSGATGELINPKGAAAWEAAEPARRMTSAHFKTLRESMGMTFEWVGDMLEVAPRTVQRWESDQNPKGFAVDFINAWWELFAVQIENAVAGVERLEDELGVAEEVVLSRYLTDRSAAAGGLEHGMTAGMHAALLGHIAMALKQEELDAGLEINFVKIEE